jgi:hypothetical protein
VKFLRIEVYTQILDAEHAAPIDNRSEERVFDVAACALGGEDPLAAREVGNDRRGAGEEAPARYIGSVRLRV